jgi:NAD(P)-dependent dehydrogenase (short-subunit alcohol dehydrogenase family)
MIGDLDGKTAFVTGAASGIGLGMARAFAAAGMKVAMADRDAGALNGAATDLAATGAEVLALPLDVTDRAAWAKAAEATEARLGPVRLLCNNAGVSALGLMIETIEPDVWDKVVDINLGGVFNGLHTFIGRMRAAGGGHIVNTASLAGLSAATGLGAYVASKFAVVGLSETLRTELAPANIGVSVLCPGAVRTQLWRTSRRIRGLPDIDTPPPEALIASGSPDGLDPDAVGRQVLEAVRANEFYVLTHGTTKAVVARRHDEIMTAFERAGR